MRIAMKMNSITGRWITNILSIIIIALVIVEVAVIALSGNSIDSSVDNYLQSQGSLIQKYFSEYIKENNYDFGITAKDVLSIAVDYENLKVQIFATDGHMVASTAGYYSGEEVYLTSVPVIDRIRDIATGESLVVYTAPLEDGVGNILGSVRLASSLAQVNVQKAVFIAVTLVLGAVMIGVMALSGTYFIKSIVNPIREIAATAKTISKGDFTARIDKKQDDEIGELTDSINNMAADLSKIDQMKNDFISSVSHELRTPLTAIKGWNETLMSCDPQEDNETIKMGLGVIASEADRLSNMVEELLDYSKIQSGKVTLSIKNVDVSELMAETVLVFKEKAAKRGIKLIYHGQAGQMPCEGDDARIKQVFVNVVDNAIKHSYDNSEINVFAERIEGGYALTVADKGEGIREEDLPYIKTRFYKGRSNVPGSGLGLAISDSIINLHGGYLDIYSKEGKGTTVVISFPEKLPKNLSKRNLQHPAAMHTPY